MFGRTSTPEPVPAKPNSGPSSNPLGNMGTMSAIPSPSQPGRASPFGAATTMGASVIGTDLTILGEKITIISQNKLQIDGDVRGDVNGRQLIIGEDGSVIGTVSAEQIEVRGGVRGAIKAQSVTLQPTAVVEGDIFHITLSIAEGAQFDGRVKRAKDANDLKPNLDVESLGSSNGSAAPASTSTIPGYTG